jgi:ABC-type amino acid transport system permease subunit
MATKTFIMPVGGFILGIVLGCGFGFIQHESFAHACLGQIDTLASTRAGILGSWARSIFLLVMLTFFQPVFTLLFGDNDIQWILSGGCVRVCMNYGAAYPSRNVLSFIE